MRKTANVLTKLASLVAAADDDSRDWSRSPRMNSAWRRFFVMGACCGLTLLIIDITPVLPLLSKNSRAVILFRMTMAVTLSVLIAMLIDLTVAYFQFTIVRQRRIRLGAVLFFYLAAVVLFGALYYYMFAVMPSNFQYDHARIEWLQSLGERSSRAWQTKLSFVLYSAFKSTGGNLRELESNAAIISILNYIQTLYTFSLVALLIAGYVNQQTRRTTDAD